MSFDELDLDTATARAVVQAARELGACAHEEIPLAPWVILGDVDGRAFYLRERSGVYRVVVASEEEPGENPWSSPAAGGITVATGVSGDLVEGGALSPSRAVQVAVTAVRTWLRQQGCTHLQDSGDRYCRQCGSPLVDPALP